MSVNCIYPKATGETKPWQEHTSRKQNQKKRKEEKKNEITQKEREKL